VTDVLVIAGPTGVGKSSVAFEVSLQLQAVGTEHALIDTDELDRIYPVPDDLPALTERNLAAVWQAFVERGARRLILVGVHLDKATELAWIARAVPEARFTLVHLRASEASLRGRVTQREIGTGADAQRDRTRRQAAMAAGAARGSVHLIETDDVSVVAIARRILDLWPTPEPVPQ
jgi:hypothetical protein